MGWKREDEQGAWMSDGVLRWIGLLVCDIVALVQTI